MRWIEDRAPHDGPLNMAIDEVLLLRGGGVGEGILRTYRWAGRERSIGYFSPISLQSGHRASGGRVVRRLTGGGVVDHGDGVDLTYSLIFPAGHRLWSLSAGDRYKEIHEVVAEAMRRAGMDCALAPVADPEEGRSAGSPRGGEAGGACFLRPVGWDVLAPDGRKLAGGGQRRRRDGLLHQGSIRAGVGDGFPVLLAAGFGTGEAEGLDPEVLEEARGLAATKYGTEKWLRGRECSEEEAE